VLSNIQSFKPRNNYSILVDDFGKMEGNLLMPDSLENSLNLPYNESSLENRRDQSALKDFEEFLDPNVLEDEDFRMNE
jgi:hypothetical protein